jgi:hypothetical protein
MNFHSDSDNPTTYFQSIADFVLMVGPRWTQVIPQGMLLAHHDDRLAYFSVERGAFTPFGARISAKRLENHACRLSELSQSAATLLAESLQDIGAPELPDPVPPRSREDSRAEKGAWR